MSIKEQLKAEIERRLNEDYCGNDEQDITAQGVCCSLLSFLDTLEEEPVELEKEIDDYYEMYRDEKGIAHDKDNGEICCDWKTGGREISIRLMVCHFYELGREHQRTLDADLGSPKYERGFEDGREYERKNKEQPNNMIQWTGNNLKEVIEFTGKSPRFDEWFKTWDEYESYVHSHGNIFKLFNEDGSHLEVPVGAWIFKTPDGRNVPSTFIYQEQPFCEDDEKYISMLEGFLNTCWGEYFLLHEREDFHNWIENRLKPACRKQEVCEELDEAARRYATEDAGLNPDGTEKFQVIQEEADAFKAGAMWDRKQGVSFNTEVGWIDGPTIMDWPDDILDGFKMGDKVIVQIRKKDE